MPSSRSSPRGSSPRAWGAHLDHRGASAARRFIPTCVGSALGAPEDDQGVSVHPHVRGERSFHWTSTLVSVGSSPRAWGAQLHRPGFVEPERFIPTCVGSARRSAGVTGRAPVHPHVRGERPLPSAVFGSKSGSSPRAWGAQPAGPPLLAAPRFIPTCVGSARACWRRPRPTAVHPHVRGERGPGPDAREGPLVHPHVRGERLSVAMSFWCHAGSSPRAWGALAVLGLILAVVRFIPTCVGSAACWSTGSPPSWFIPTCVGSAISRTGGDGLSAVHPHVRGERPVLSPRKVANCGSSPRAWGALECSLVGDCGLRFIPTCVGSASRRATRPGGPPVHPHVRGERASTRSCWVVARGSSPRAWGARAAVTAELADLRFIPTCVGSASYGGTGFY